MKYKKYNKYKKMLTSVYDAHKNNNDKRVIGIAAHHLVTKAIYHKVTGPCSNFNFMI